MREIAAQSLVGLPVYSLNEGETLGHVKQLIIDPAAHCLLALAVDKKGPRKNLRIIPAEKIHHLGADAVTITERTAANRAANLPQLMKYLNRPNHLIGNRLITDDGCTLGKIEEYYLDGENHNICRLDINGNKTNGETPGRAALDGRYIISIGPAAVMIDRTALQNSDILPPPNTLLNKVSATAGKISARIGSAFEKSEKTLKNPPIHTELHQSSENSERQQSVSPAKTNDNIYPLITEKPLTGKPENFDASANEETEPQENNTNQPESQENAAPDTQTESIE